MNDRIKTMWETAAQRDDLWGQARYEKFAELIVLKCAEIADTAEPFLASDLIKEHFGVEE
jgi:hypothetical protein